MSIVNEIKKETFPSEQRLILKEVRKCRSKKDEDYYHIIFNICVNYSESNPRENKFLNVPVYASPEFMSEHFAGMKPSDIKDMIVDVVLEFTPFVKYADGQTFSNWSASMVELSIVEQNESKF
jgi:hypothetical protein